MTSGRTEEFYEGNRDQVLSTRGVGETMQEVLARRWSRRGLVKGGLAAGLVLTARSHPQGVPGCTDGDSAPPWSAQLWISPLLGLMACG